MTWRLGSVCAMALVCAFAVGCSKRSSGDGQGGARDMTMSVEVVSAASGATRMELSPSQTHVAVEIGGDWVAEEYSPDWGPVPPVLKLIQTATEIPTTVAQGWIASPVSERGELLIVEEHGEEYRYRLRRLGGDGATLTLQPPDGIWLMRGVAFGGAGRSFVVLRQPELDTLGPGIDYRERLWIASIDTARLKLLATTTLNLTGSLNKQPTHAKPTIVASPVRSELYLLELPEPESTTWHVVSLDGDRLRQKWKTPITSRQPAEPHEERDRLRTAMLAIGGTGEQVVVIYGRPNGQWAIRTTEILAITTASGQISGQIQPPDVFGAVRHPRAVPGKPELALLHATTERSGWDWFGGVSVIDASRRVIAREYSVSKSHLGDRYETMKAVAPQAMVVTKASKVLFAPRWFRWAVRYEPGGPWPEEPDPLGSAFGAKRPEVTGFVKIPAGWHRKGRPRVDAIRAWREAPSDSER